MLYLFFKVQLCMQISKQANWQNEKKMIALTEKDKKEMIKRFMKDEICSDFASDLIFRHQITVWTGS